MFATLLQSFLVRLIPVSMVLLALQRSIFVDILVFGVVAQLLLAFAASAGAAGGSERGAIVGFAAGVMYDLVGGTPLGSSAIALSLGGVVAGLLALVAADPQWWLKAVFVGLGAGAGEATVPVVRLFIGESNPWPPAMLKVVVVVAISSAVMSVALVPLARWCLRIRGPEWTAPAEAEPV